MSSQHPRPWHRGSEFGEGLRFALDREQRAVWRARLDLARRAGRITALHAEIGRALLRRLGTDGRCDPAHDTIAADVECSPRTVRRALKALYELGMLRWINRLVRMGPRTEQTSNAYTLIVAVAAAFAPRPKRATRCVCSDGQVGRETQLIKNPDPSLADAARQALAAVRHQLQKKWLERARSAKTVPV